MQKNQKMVLIMLRHDVISIVWNSLDQLFTIIPAKAL